MDQIPELTIRDRLRISRDHAGIRSANKMAAKISQAGDPISGVTIHRMETGRCTIRDWHLRAWARVTGVSYHWLKTGEVPPDLVGSDTPWNSQIPDQARWLAVAK